MGDLALGVLQTTLILVGEPTIDIQMKLYLQVQIKIMKCCQQKFVFLGVDIKPVM